MLVAWLAARGADAAIFTVDSTGDQPDALLNGTCATAVATCTLRAAIQEANNAAGPHTINFTIAGGGPHTISPATALPAVNQAGVTINGYSQPGSSPNTLAIGNDAVLRIELDGSAIVPDAVNGLTFDAASGTVRGLAINRFTGYGIVLNASGGVIRGNFVGTDVTGSAGLGNNRGGVGSEGGIGLFAGSQTIGGTAPADRNLVAGNNANCGRGIELWDSSGNTIQGNYVGTNAAGTAAIPNGCGGIVLDGNAGVGSDNNSVGGAVAGAGNLISGNQVEGIFVQVGSDNNTIQGNTIGLNAAGTAPIPNGAEGIKILSSGNLVGGDTALKRNVISGNTTQGVRLQGASATGNGIRGNYIGTDVNGTLDVGNTSHGVIVNGAATGNTIGGSAAERNVISGNGVGAGVQGVRIDGASTANNVVLANYIGTNAAGTGALPNSSGGIAITNSAANNTVGGTTATAGNRIALNTTYGVNIGPSAGAGNAILGNAIYGNSELGIDLLTDGVTANDGGDGDTGPNDLLNFPVLTAATGAGGSVSVGFQLDVPAGSYRVEFFRNPSGTDPTHGEGEVFVGARTLTHPGGGAFAFSHVVAAQASDRLTATTTFCTDGATCAAFGSTSEFSAWQAVACCSLVTATSSTGVSVTAASQFKLVFDHGTGGHPHQFYDLAESPLEDAVHDLAGGASVQEGMFLDELTLLSDGQNYRSDQGPAGRARLLEATSTRVLVRSQSHFGRPSSANRITGIEAVGDWSLYGSGRIALHWERQTTSAVDTTFQQLHLNLHQQAAAPLNAWTAVAQGAALCTTGCSGPAGADFVMLQIEQPGARTDFLKVLHQDWPAAGETWGSGNVAQEWVEDSWSRLTPTTLAADSTEGWDFLTYFKPTSFVDHNDPAVTTRAADYRGPDDLATPSAPAAGAGWFDTAESTAAPSDFYNEKEAAYTLEIDPVAGLQFDIDGAATPRYQPFFKIRKWRSHIAPNTLTLEGVTLNRNAGFKADVMPVSRASFHRSLLWRSTLQDLAAITTPDVGSAGSVTGAVTYEAARYGGGARISASGDSIRVPLTGNFDAARGVLGFWFRPAFNHDDGVVHDICGFSFDASNYFFVEKRGAADANELWFRINASGNLSTYRITSANYSWRAGEWVHLTIEWNDTAALGGQQRIELNDVEPTHTDSAVDYDSTLLTLPANLRFGNSDGDATFAPGVYDEIELVQNHPILAAGGLVGDTSEFLGDPAPAQNFTLNFTPVDGSRRGRYLQLGATARFRGLNVALATPGVGVAVGALQWEYWNGTDWADLETVPGFTDTTSSLTRSGNVYWTDDPPGWAPYSVFGGVDIYRIRVHLPAGPGYSQFPVEGIVTTDVLLAQLCGDITADAQTIALAAPFPTAVRLQSFSASGEDRAVRLAWQTASELENLGFHLYRAPSENGPWARLTSSLIPGLGSSAEGRAYSHRDSGLLNGTRYFYRLEDVDAASKATAHGPVWAVPQAAVEAGGGERGGRDDRRQSASAASCPDWVLAAYGAASGSDPAAASSPSPRCTRHGEPEAVSLRTLARDARSTTLELRTGGFYALHTLTSAGEPSGRVRVFVPGFDFAEDEARPALPLRRALTDAVVGSRVQLGGVRALELASYKGLVPAALGRAEMELEWDGTVRASRRDARQAPRRFPKGELVKLLPSLFQGEAKRAVVEIAPLRYDEARGQLVLARRVLVKLLFTGREPGESGRGSLGRAPRPRKPDVSGEILARLHTTSRGLHAVSFDELFPGQRRSIAAAGLRLERQGEPVAFHVEPAGASFGPGGRLFFFAEHTAASTDFTAEVAYELIRSADGVRMPLGSAAPGSESVPEPPVVTRSFETNRFYQPGLLDAADPWLWEALGSGATRTLGFTLAGVSASGSAELDVRLQGASESGASVDHHLSASLNGVLLGEARFAGKKPHRLTLSLPAALLREGPNELALTSVADTGVWSLVFLDRFSLTHPHTSALAGGRFEGAWSDSGAASVTGATFSPVLVELLPGPPSRPAWLTGFQSSGDSLRFQAEAGRLYLAVSQEALLAPRVAAPEAFSLRATTNQADYLLIAPAAFLAAAQPLVVRRRDQGLTARAVTFEDIAAEFGHGQPSAEAIQAFLAHAFHAWARPSPRYVLLLGDSSYDPRNFMGSSPPAPLPAFWTKTSYLWTAADPLLAAVNGPDSLPDLAIGRLPASSPEQAHALVQKLIAWEDSGQRFSGPVALVADNPDLAGDFEADVEDVRQSFFSTRDARVLRLSELGAAARPAILDVLDSGLSQLHYVGHGGAAVWASENVWNSWDAPSLQAQSLQPLLVTMNCLNGYFVAPSYDSLAESLLKAEGRGAIGAFSPSGLSLDGPAHQYHRALVSELVSGRHDRLGDAVLAAQKSYAETGLMPELLSVYHLLGDPATPMR